MKKLAYIALLAIIFGLGACKSSKQAPAADDSAPMEVNVAGFGSKPITQSQVQILPKAVAYKMNGDYALNIPLTVRNGRLVSFPAPSDITAGSTPIQLAGGWWLDRRGVSYDTRFSSYTYARYAALPEAPSPAQLLKTLIPGARITSLRVLPMTLTEALADTAAVNTFLRRP